MINVLQRNGSASDHFRSTAKCHGHSVATSSGIRKSELLDESVGVAVCMNLSPGGHRYAVISNAGDRYARVTEYSTFDEYD